MSVMSKDATATQRVPFNDLVIQWQQIATDVRSDFEDIFSRSAYCLGPHVEAFERDIAAWMGTKYAIGVNSGTSALHLAMVCAGAGPGDEVLVPAHTFIATVWGVLYAGATPVLCDVDEATGTIDLADAEKRLSKRTKVIAPVHLYGQPAAMDAVMAFARRHGLRVVEDAAQSIGARWNGKMTGTIGDMGCVSFYPGKNLGAAGEAGLVVTDDDAIATRLKSLRNHGQTERYVHGEIGYNYRMDGFQGSVLRHKLKRLDGWIAERKRLADAYASALSGLPLRLPEVINEDHVWHLYVVRTPRRDQLKAYLQDRAIETGLHYPVPIHRQPCMSGHAIDVASYPISDRWATEGLSLPLFVGMTNEQQVRVIEGIKDFFVDG